MPHIEAVDRSVPEVTWVESGERAARQGLWTFLGADVSTGDWPSAHSKSRLDTYGTNRNDPCIAEGSSHLSPYLHFGHLSAQRVCLEVSPHSSSPHMSTKIAYFVLPPSPLLGQKGLGFFL
jgi:deoxyribodipyrimidine photolyase